MASTGSVDRIKDVLLEHVLRDIKGLQSYQSERERMEDVVTPSNTHVQALCEHLDRILLHGLRNSDMGYWATVSYFTRSEAITMINQLPAVKTNLGRGRAWLYLALNEQSMESYVRMFLENQQVMQDFYLRDAFIRDVERLLVLQTLMAALDFIFFDLPIDSIYLDYGATKATSTVGTLQHNITPDITPTFIGTLTPSSKPDTDLSPSPSPPKPGTSPDRFSITGIIGSVFNKDKKGSPSLSRGGGVASSGEHPSPETTQARDGGGGGDEGGVVSSVEVDREDLRGSFSPHRTLAQSNSHGMAPGLAGSDSSTTNSPHTSTRVPVANGEGEEEDLVVHASKSKSSKGKAKKKKKKKKSKITESADAKPESLLDPIQAMNERPDIDKIRSELERSTSIREETDGHVEPGLAESQRAHSPAPNLTERAPGKEWGVTESPRRAHMSSPDHEEEKEMSYEQWAPKTSSGELLEGRGQFPPPGELPQDLGEFEEECDMGFGQGHLPVTHPPPSVVEAGNKRLSLADELELANELESPSFPAAAEEEGGRGHETAPPVFIKLPTPTQSDTPQGDATPTSWRQEPEPVPSLGQSQPEEEAVEQLEREQGLCATPPSEEFRYEGSPIRPSEITNKDRRASDVEIDDTTRLVISLDILHQEEEELHRLVQVATPTGVGQQRTCYVLLTSHCTYILRKDGIEGHYSRELSIKYSSYDHIVIGLGWQSLHLMYRRDTPHTPPQEYILLTGSEAVSRGLVDSVRTLAAACPDNKRSIPLNKDDENRVNAIEKELIKLGSQTSMDIMQYLLVNWEQLSGDAPLTSSVGAEVGVSRSGYLNVKTTNLIGIATWRPAYFTIRDGELQQYSSEEDDMPKNTYQIRNCGGCVRATAESKPFALSILGADQSVMVVLAANNEEDLTQWMQTLCEAVIEREMPGSPTLRKACFFCALLLTQNKIHVLQEDWNNKTVQLVTSCAVTDVNDISVDKSLPYYCTISYDHENDQGLWLICFNTEYELGKFEAALGGMWREEFQVDLQFSEVSDQDTRQRSHRAVELMQGSKYRSDSMTRGRTEFTYSGRY